MENFTLLTGILGGILISQISTIGYRLYSTMITMEEKRDCVFNKKINEMTSQFENKIDELERSKDELTEIVNQKTKIIGQRLIDLARQTQRTVNTETGCYQTLTGFINDMKPIEMAFIEKNDDLLDRYSELLNDVIKRPTEEEINGDDEKELNPATSFIIQRPAQLDALILDSEPIVGRLT